MTYLGRHIDIEMGANTMQVKTTQKISRSAVATVLATSSVALGLPAQTNAAEFFKDVKPADFFYTAVNELAEKKIVSGYGDGTFRPFNNVTRGEAAKMLALSLKLDVANAETTQFSDVKKGDIFYKYIAALANKGIINGYPDGSFKPNEVVQRGAMAKMVALGYEFALAKNITHPFKDVDQKYIFNQHIQTLVNLNITKGTSFNTFEPGKAVTRGELATFISRANKADAGKPIYVVDNIIGNKIYINSVGYTIGPNVASYLKTENKSALIGGYIEGTFDGMTLTNVTKLTLNATGNANSIYTFDGGNSVYNGTLVVNGSYLKFKNWTLDGQTIISETPRKSLAQYNRISEIKIASLASDIIDFTKPTNPDDGNLNDDGNGGSLKPGTGTSPNAPYREKLSQIHKYVDFTNVTVRNLFVEQNRTYVAAQKEIAMVTIRRDVEFVEFNFNMRNLYIEGDESLTLYGTHDITTVYKNSYYSVYFNSNSEINTLIVDNRNGWIDLGDYVVIGNVIIPPKTTPNDIFDDYKNDNDKIGKIEDNTGEEVDRNPIENGIVPDVTKPIVHSLTVEADSNQATASLTVNETGKYHYLILPEGASAPTVREIVSAQSGLSGSGTVTESEMTPDGRYTTTFVVKGLESVMKYTMYVVHVDDAGNFSARQERDFETKDGTPPTFEQVGTLTKVSPMPGGRRIQFDFKPSETGVYYYFVREAQNVDNTITVDDVIAGAQDSGGVTAQMVTNGHTIVIREDENGNQLKPLTKYVVYSVLVDDSGNKIIQANMFKSPVTTSVLDETPPYVTGPSETELQHLIPANTTMNQFYMYFNEKLDKSTAENVDNYLLSGTGIVNVPTQIPIKPTSVKYEDFGTGGRVLITIPSLTGFVHGDTLVVTVLKGVLDLAENEFENANNVGENKAPRNFAKYEHKDPYFPTLSINSIERNEAQKKALISYNASKAGQIYYMLIPDSIDISHIKPEDFVAEFGPTPTDKFNAGSGKIYLEGSRAKLNAPLTTEMADHSFVYDYVDFTPSSFESYSIYMVLKDRSGRLSGIQHATMIADKEPPTISSFNAIPTPGTDTSVTVTMTSENESGRVHIGYAPKYIKDTTVGSPTYNKYIKNPAVYDVNGNLKTFGANTSMSNEDRLKEFRDNVPNVDSYNLEKGTNNIVAKGTLQQNTEYVFYMAAVDIFGNITVTNNQSTNMIKEVYTDGIAPTIYNNVVYRTINDQLITASGLNSSSTNGEFELTFSETLGRVYKDSNNVKDTLDQGTNISSNTSLNSLVVIRNSNNEDITGYFELGGYTEGTASNPSSKLVIKAKNPTISEQNFTVQVIVEDQNINVPNKANNVVDLAKYIYPGDNIINSIRYARLQPDTIVSENDESTKMNVSLDLRIPLNKDGENLSQQFYYTVVNDPAITWLSKSIVEEVILKADNARNEYLTGSIISYGKVLIDGQQGLSFIQPLTAIQYSPSTINVFKSNHNLFIFTKDKYGNIIWAKPESNPTQNYINIQPKSTN